MAIDNLTSDDRAIILTLRAALRDDLSEPLPSSCDWPALLTFSGRQNILPLVLDGFSKYKERQSDLAMPLETMLMWYKATKVAEQRYALHQNLIQHLDTFYAEHGVRMTVLKGYPLSLCYPVPAHRTCIDIDIYLHGDHAKADEAIQKELGLAVDCSHQHHTVFKVKGVQVENHYDFINVLTHPSHVIIERHLKRLAEQAPDTCLALHVLAHSAGHFAAESVELRHVTDWYLLRRHYGNRIDWAEVEGICREAGMDAFLACWNRVALGVMEGAEMDAMAQRVLCEVIHPKYGRKHPEGRVARLWFKLRRWLGSLWKMRLVYRNENRLKQFFMHLRSHLIQTEQD